MFPKTGNKLHRRTGAAKSRVNLGNLIAAALKAELGSTHQANKTVMRWTGVSERTAKHWLAGTHVPSAEHLVALARNSDEVLKVFLLAADRGPTIVTVQLVDLRAHLLRAVALIDQQV